MNLDTRQLFDAESRSTRYVAINPMSSMMLARSKMCRTTALKPGFRGFDWMKRPGACPVGMRLGRRH